MCLKNVVIVTKLLQTPMDVFESFGYSLQCMKTFFLFCFVCFFKEKLSISHLD